jgi:Ca2+-binding EF-hand superfamily protein
MLSELKQRKMARVFKVFDVDKNGFVEQADFERIVKRLTEAKGIQAGSPDFNAVRERYIAFWEVLQQSADTNNDQRVSLDEWMAAHTLLLSSNAEENYDTAIKPIAEVILEAVDLDKDGIFTPEDYRLFYKIYEINDSPEEALRHIVPQGRTSLSRSELEALARDFYLSEAPAAPGNWLLGPF